MSRLFCFGLGYSARTLVHRLLAEGWTVAGTTRDGGRHDLPDSVTVLPFDRGRPLADAGAALAGATHVLSSVPPDREGDAVLDMHGTALRELAPRLAWIGYLSTTGVYGDRDGGWVDEDTPPAPDVDRARRRLAAEEGWRALPGPAHIFRLGGIYGPGRSPLERVRRGEARRIVKPGQVFCRIHVDDIAGAVAASMARPVPEGRIYNVVDDEPAPPQDVIAEAARLLDVTPPPEEPFEGAELSPMAASFYNDSKRVSNRRLREELGYAPRYPDYRAGLRALLAGM